MGIADIVDILIACAEILDNIDKNKNKITNKLVVKFKNSNISERVDIE